MLTVNMMTDIYAIYLNEGNNATWGILKEKWPDRHLIVNDRLAFVALDTITTTGNIADTVGMNLESKTIGIVFQLSAYNGFNSQNIWEWLEKVSNK